MTPFDPNTADLTDPAVRKWCVVSVAPSLRATKYLAGTVIQILSAEDEAELRLSRNEGFTIEIRTATNAQCAGWLAAKAAEGVRIDTANNAAKRLRERR